MHYDKKPTGEKDGSHVNSAAKSKNANGVKKLKEFKLGRGLVVC